MIYRVVGESSEWVWSEESGAMEVSLSPGRLMGAFNAGVADDAWGDLPMPTLSNPRVRFWFTERGWRAYGLRVAAEAGPRRVHPARPGLLQRQAQRGQRRIEPRRHQRQPVVELRRRRGDRRSVGAGPAGPAVPGHARHPHVVLRHPDAAGGDEMGRTQQGNNNAYCQDNEITWFDWARPDADLLAFTR